jgi:hypothetical protein
MLGSGKYHFRKMEQADIPVVRDFMSTNFGKTSHMGRTNWVDWQYVDNTEDTQIYLCLCGQRLVAMSGVIPVKLLIRDRVYSGAFSINTMVNHLHRRNGIAQQFHLQRLHNYDFALSSGQSPANRALYMKMGWSIYANYYDVLIVKKFPRPYFNKSFLKELYSWLHWKTGSTLISANDYSLKMTTEVPAEAAYFSKKRWSKESIGPVRLPEYLQWRYQNHPYFDYYFVRVHHKEKLVGFAVMRDGDACKILLDVYCKSTNLEEFLLAIASNLPTEKILGKITGASLKASFKKAHWTVMPDGTFLIGHSRNPDMRQTAKNMSWSFFLGDSDKDKGQGWLHTGNNPAATLFGAELSA